MLTYVSVMQVLDAYLVVKLHEAMFDMKEQLQKMEAQVLSVTKQKESLERMLESKAKYIRVGFVVHDVPSPIVACVTTCVVVSLLDV